MRIRALDSIRGILLLQMTLDHFGKPISHYLYQCFGFFSAAEGFFFLSGFVGMLAATSKSVKDPKQTWMRWRALKTWRYHAATLLLLCCVGFWFVPSIYSSFRTMFQHPLESILWSVALVHTPEWMDVLPLYVIFLGLGSLSFPFFVRAQSKTRILLLWLPSLAIWLAAQFGLRDFVNSIFPQWIYHGDFDPYAWQFLYFTGAAVASWWKMARKEEAEGNVFAVRTVLRFTPAILALLIFGFLWRHQFIPIGIPADAFTSKVHLGVLRFANFFLFVLAICWSVRRWPTLLDFRPTNILGRHSLDVYTAHIFLIYFWFATPNSIRYHSPWNVLIPISACVLLWILAKLREPKKGK